MFDRSDVRSTWEALMAADPAVADRDELRAIAARSAEARAWLDGLEVRVARRVNEISKCPDTGVSATEAADAVAADGRRSRRDAARASQRSGVCDTMPDVERALDRGEISGDHVDVIANVVRGLTPAERSRVDAMAAELLAAAREQTPERFARTARRIVDEAVASGADGAGGGRGLDPVDPDGPEPDPADPEGTEPGPDPDPEAAAAERERRAQELLARQKRNSKVKTWVDQATGMWKMFAEVDPETGAKLMAALDAQLASVKQREGTAGMPLDRLKVTALEELMTAEHAGAPRVPEAYVHIDYRTLLGQVHEHSLCEMNDGVPIPAETARRLCCEAKIVPVVLGGDGSVLDVGREERTVNREQRRALRAMYRTCAHPHCSTPFEYCHIHHVRWWRLLGFTDICNLLPLCNAHHHLVHEGGWGLMLDADRVITLTAPNGTVVFRGCTIDRASDASGADPPPGERSAAA